MGRLGQNFIIYSVALAAGWVLNALHVPLAWMIGAMLSSCCLTLARGPLPLFPMARTIGQMAIGATVGLAFSAEALAVTFDLILPMLFLTFTSLASGLLAAYFLSKFGKTDMVSACLASLAIGPVESATLARQYDRDPAPIIFTQCLRLFLLLAILPTFVVWMDGSVTDLTAGLRSDNISGSGVALLVLIAIGGAVVAKLIHFPNPFFNGPTAASVAAMLLAWPVSPLPYLGLIAAQLMMGVSLGAVFNRAFLVGARRYATVTPFVILLMIVLCEGFALFTGWMIGLPWQVAMLAGAPGGVGELGLTARILQIGVPIVIAFHLVRIFLTQLFVPLIVKICAARVDLSP